MAAAVVGKTAPARAAEFASVPNSVPAARHLVRDHLRSVGVATRMLHDCLVVVSELVANAIRHARPLATASGPGTVRLRWAVTRGQVWIGVTDGGSQERRPHVESASPADVGGRGLAIVDAIAAEWGVTRNDGEVTVYAVVSA